MNITNKEQALLFACILVLFLFFGGLLLFFCQQEEIVTTLTQSRLCMNNTAVKSVRDSVFASGRIMLFVENGNSSNGITASFDTVAVYTAPDHLLTP